jgi:hypothetical protein
MIVSLISSRSTRRGRLEASIAAAVWLALAPAAPAGAQTLTRGTAPECLLLAQSGHRGHAQPMSTFGGKADINTATISPFVALKPQKSFGVAMLSKNSLSASEKM